MAVPVGFAAVFALTALVAGESGAPSVLAVEAEAGRLIAIFGAIVAVGTFERGDYLRRAWLLGGSCFAILLVADIGTIPAVAAALGPRTDLWRGLISLVANLGWIVQMAMVARAWTIAGLEETGTPGERRAWLAGALLAAVAVEGGPFVHDLHAVIGGDLVATTAIADELGAAVGLAFLVSVLRAASVMRGGLLRWPWGYLTASGLGWAALDGVTALGGALGVSGTRFAIATEACRALASGFYCAAGLAQRMALSDPA
jgi:hypothetical protein